MSKFHTNLKVSQKIHSLGVKAASAAAGAACAAACAEVREDADTKSKIIEKGLEILRQKNN